MQTGPCRLITAPAKHTLQCYRAHPVFLAGHPPHGAKPHSQWRSRILKHRACGRRNLIAAICALNTARLQRPALPYITSRTTKSVRPAEIEQVLPASLLRAEAPLKLLKRPRIILFHDPEHCRVGLPESNGYPVGNILFARQDSHRQHAGDGAQAALESKFPTRRNWLRSSTRSAP